MLAAQGGGRSICEIAVGAPKPISEHAIPHPYG